MITLIKHMSFIYQNQTFNYPRRIYAEACNEFAVPIFTS